MRLKKTETLELKKSTSELKEAVAAIGAMLNKHGRGEIYFGVKDDGLIVGQQLGKNTAGDISRAISAHLEPEISPEIKRININGKECIKVTFRGHEKPYYAYGRVYLRGADENKRLSPAEIKNLILYEHKEALRWDTEPCAEAKVADISAQKLRQFLKTAGLKYDNTRNALLKLKLVRQARPLNAAVVLFARSPQVFYPNVKLRCALFSGADTAVILDRKEFEGDVFFLIVKAEAYILEHINLGMRVDGLQRVDVPEIAREAFREDVINAFCHRDWREYDSVNVAVFADRVEIRSPGLLYNGLTVARITAEMVSERRNELLAEMLQRVRFVEKWGRGIKLILSKEPGTVFKEIGNHFIAVFKRGAAATLPPTVRQKSKEKSKEKILAIIVKRPVVTTGELARLTTLSLGGVEKIIRGLKKKGALRRVGPDKGGHWEVL
ncbi:MAG: ATP-dependent DNA helicase [Elusimicrobia bacterium CG08_land_8_20_14_0_20_59_10]|nr:MAG: ATP-dependent DNA helicase [Elusimicrobia bacterium CG08_land_8_20_14_0_20_59_10]